MEIKLKVIDILERNKDGIHLRMLAEKAGSSFPNVRRYANILEKEGVVKKEKMRNMVVVKLKKSQKTLAYLKMVHTERFQSLPAKAMTGTTDLLDGLGNKPLIMAIFGSYAKGNFNPKSDLDILLVYQKIGSSEDVENTSRKISMRTGLRINPVYLDYAGFEKRMIERNPGIMKEIGRDSIILVGIEYYYSLWWE
jgi:predicted nucleotidyltransferase/predicted transcriptional regulator